MNQINQLSEKIDSYFKGTCLNYGEGFELITTDEGANYFSESKQGPCAVNDNFDLVVFWVKLDANPTDQPGVGLKQRFSRKITYRLIGNSKKVSYESLISAFINELGMEYINSNFDAKQIARQYFGLPEHNFQTFFFSIEFKSVEPFICPEC